MAAGSITGDGIGAFGELCRDTRAGFSAAVDLVLIHNERTVRGTEPRSTLDPLTVLLAVAAWERFVADVEALATGTWEGPGRHAVAKGRACLGTPDGDGPGPAARTLAAASGGRLPGDWRVRHFAAWTGRAPQQPVELTGAELGPLAEAVDAAIRPGDTVCWRALPLTRASRGPGGARAVLALLLQVTDQAIDAIATECEHPRPATVRLPPQWFAATPPSGLRGVLDPGDLWGGYALLR